MWSAIYDVIYRYDKAAFQFDGAAPKEFAYYSYTVMTTLGFGDITPVNRVAASLTNMESIAGQMFLAIFIARLMGLYLARELRENRQTGPNSRSWNTGFSAG